MYFKIFLTQSKAMLSAKMRTEAIGTASEGSKAKPRGMMDQKQKRDLAGDRFCGILGNMRSIKRPGSPALDT